MPDVDVEPDEDDPDDDEPDEPEAPEPLPDEDAPDEPDEPDEPDDAAGFAAAGFAAAGLDAADEDFAAVDRAAVDFEADDERAAEDLDVPDFAAVDREDDARLAAGLDDDDFAALERDDVGLVAALAFDAVVRARDAVDFALDVPAFAAVFAVEPARDAVLRAPVAVAFADDAVRLAAVRVPEADADVADFLRVAAAFFAAVLRARALLARVAAAFSAAAERSADVGLPVMRASMSSAALRSSTIMVRATSWLRSGAFRLCAAASLRIFAVRLRNPLARSVSNNWSRADLAISRFPPTGAPPRATISRTSWTLPGEASRQSARKRKCLTRTSWRRMRRST